MINNAGYEIPFAAIGIVSKNIGTTSTEDGTFYFQISKNELKDTLTISSLGFSTYTLPVSQLTINKKMVIILEEKTTSLSEVVVNSTPFYVRKALKKLKNSIRILFRALLQVTFQALKSLLFKKFRLFLLFCFYLFTQPHN